VRNASASRHAILRLRGFGTRFPLGGIPNRFENGNGPFLARVLNPKLKGIFAGEHRHFCDGQLAGEVLLILTMACRPY
jgi:hypothetical protein